jgi:hypothetical protein
MRKSVLMNPLIFRMKNGSLTRLGSLSEINCGSQGGGGAGRGGLCRVETKFSRGAVTVCEVLSGDIVRQGKKRSSKKESLTFTH